jgi:amidohydrolase
VSASSARAGQDAVDAILSGYPGLQAAQEALYKDLHAHPELSHAEHRTARAVAAELEGSGAAVTTGIGGAGVVGALANGDGPAVLLRAELDALPVAEDTGVDYASRVTTTVPDGRQVPVAHACGHDLHMAAVLGAVRLLAGRQDRWRGTLLALFQPGEETGDGAQAMVDDGLFKRIPVPDVALAQHLLPGIAGTVGTCPGPFMSAEDAIQVTVYGRGGHGALPQNTVDPVVLAAMIIVRLQTVVAREVTPGETAIVTVGAVQAGTRGNVIGDHALLQLNLRSYAEPTRQRTLDAIRRIVRGECEASGSPRDPDFQTLASFPLLDNDVAATDRVAAAFTAHFGADALDIRKQTVSEDFGVIPASVGVPLHVLGHLAHRAVGLPRRRAGRAAAGPAVQPLAHVPAAAAANPAHRHRGDGGGGDGVARTGVRSGWPGPASRPPIGFACR